MKDKTSTGLDQFLEKNASDISVNYFLLNKSGGESRFVSFTPSKFYQGDIQIVNNYKPVLMTQFKENYEKV